ncbi:hypothetical protein ABB37_05916 [Leptomonas pyrrhocoris]|uniref:Uncharacterized protein n=1 Tax=Leptomonas pyrrhocoris TaxID=157538 RepID=A0A0M9FZ12_LEPPY|nr:hypothetical protein ABB37_05916 [Leptomonas pyrrhocoris]KPA78829.1 hypothetical protein ABB37_05916 [Leptomonas pyrrhocoris]|eukprot:XP_015657268.1 hypothetical protein ABB37_05916 [Leptomonas pyrrhocoris]
MDAETQIIVAAVVCGLLLALLGVFIGLILYFGCAIMCCCYNEKYDVCEHAAQKRARNRCARIAIGDTAESINPLERTDVSVLHSPGPPLSLAADAPVGWAAEAGEGTQANMPSAQRNDVAAFQNDRSASISDAAVTPSRTRETSVFTSHTGETSATTCFTLQPVTAETVRTAAESSVDVFMRSRSGSFCREYQL